MLAHCFSYEFQRCPLVTLLGDVAFQHLAFVVHGPPKIVLFAGDLHEDLVQMPPPLARLHALDPPLLDLGCEQWTEALPPISDRFMTHVDTPLMEQIFDVPLGK